MDGASCSERGRKKLELNIWNIEDGRNLYLFGRGNTGWSLLAGRGRSNWSLILWKWEEWLEPFTLV
jgi:hypothetical protein